MRCEPTHRGDLRHGPAGGGVEALLAAREELLGDAGLRGRNFVRAYTRLLDEWVIDVFDAAVGDADGVALVATGGYGRAELCPGSDLDLLLVHRRRRRVAALASQLWYPLWDSGLRVGHAVRTPEQARELARHDLESATALVDLRHLAGDVELSGTLARAAARVWEQGATGWLGQLDAATVRRHGTAGEVAFLLEPDLKVGRGGLRDVHVLRWAERAAPSLAPAERRRLDQAHDELLDVRVALHRHTRGRSDVLLLQDQDAVAAALGDVDADALMTRVAAAARTISWVGDEVWACHRRSRDAPQATPQAVGLAPGLEVRAGRVELADGRVAGGPGPIEVAVAAAELGLRPGREALLALGADAVEVPTPWPEGLRRGFVELLACGRDAVGVIEDLDQAHLWTRLVPEWAAVRNRAQRNAYHRFTVDRHLLETVAEAALLAERVTRPDLLLVAALFHDIGKGRPGDHTPVGERLAVGALERMGFASDDVVVVAKLIRHHLLLPEVATRRDLTDPATAARVAEAVGEPETLRLLAALTEADARATGPAAWSSWTAELVVDLVRRVERALGVATDDAEDARPAVADFPTLEELGLLHSRRTEIRAEGRVLVVATDDRPGLFSRVAGVLALHGMQVLGAAALSDDSGRALERFRVTIGGVGAPLGVEPEDRWREVRSDIGRVLTGRLALHARLTERARSYGAGVAAARAPATRVVVDNAASQRATVLEVHAPDSVGLLYRVTRALAELDLDLRTARVETRGARVVDAFYVCDGAGRKLTDAEHLREVERAVLDAADHP